MQLLCLVWFGLVRYECYECYDRQVSKVKYLVSVYTLKRWDKEEERKGRIEGEKGGREGRMR